MKNQLLSIILFIGICGFTMTTAAQETITIGSQVWMAKNLESSSLQNGTNIIQAQSKEEWLQATANGTPAWAWYYDKTLGQQYGYLYNIYAITKGNPCPTGFRVPTNEDWEQLFAFLGTSAALDLKSLEGWETYNGRGNGTNNSGFNVLPGGIRSGYGGFNDYTKGAYLWSSTPHSEEGLWSMLLFWHSEAPKLNPSGSRGGLNCRCIKE